MTDKNSNHYLLDKMIKELQFLLNGINTIETYYKEYLQYIETCTPEELYNKHGEELILYGYVVSSYGACLNQVTRQSDEMINVINNSHFKEVVGSYTLNIIELKNRYTAYNISSDELKIYIDKHQKEDCIYCVLENLYEKILVLEKRINVFLRNSEDFLKSIQGIQNETM